MKKPKSFENSKGEHTEFGRTSKKYKNYPNQAVFFKPVKFTFNTRVLLQQRSKH